MEIDAGILYIKEHLIAGPGLPSIQGLAMGQGVWDATTTNGNGRSGGTAMLVRRPAQVLRGGRMGRGTIVIIGWTRPEPAAWCLTVQFA